MLRLLGILVLGNMISGGHRCHCNHRRRHGNVLGRSLLLGALLGMFMNRANERYAED